MLLLLLLLLCFLVLLLLLVGYGGRGDAGLFTSACDVSLRSNVLVPHSTAPHTSFTHTWQKKKRRT